MKWSGVSYFLEDAEIQLNYFGEIIFIFIFYI